MLGTNWLRCRAWPRTAADGPDPAPTGCFSEADRAGRCGGSMLVFFGDDGLGAADCAEERVGAGLRGDGGPRVGVAPFAGTETLLRVDDTFKAPGRIRLWRRVGPVAFVATVDAGPRFSPWELVCGCLFGDDSPRRTVLLSDGGSRSCPGPWPSSRMELLR